MHFKKPFGHSSEHIEHQRLTSLVNSMADAVLAVDQEIKVVLYNAAALGVLDLNTITAGISLADIFKPVDKNGQPVDIVEMVRSTEVPIINRDLRLKYGDSSSISLYMSIAPVHLGYGKDGQAGYVIMIRDITREKSLEEEREEFISVVSHELRTPIAVAEGNISNAQLIIEKGGDTAEIQTALKEAHDQTIFLSDMINDLATLSRAERGKLEIDVQQIGIHDLVNSLVVNYVPSAQAKGLMLTAEIAPNTEDIQSSALYVKEILQNFITNAIKYTSQGKVSIKVSPAENGIIFAVSDTGIGISKTDQEKVFDKFFRSEDFRTRQANGTGLGLYITMKLASRINADISVDSEPNKGSTFTVHIPNLKPIAAQTEQVAPAEEKSNSVAEVPTQSEPVETETASEVSAKTEAPA